MNAGRHPVHVGQLVVAEGALVGLVAAAVGPGWLLAGAAMAAAAVGVATFGRSGGRWWYQAVAGYRRFARRRRRAAADVVAAALADRTPSALVWLRTLAPELTVRPVRIADRAGRGVGGVAVGGAELGGVGVGADATGWFGAVAVGPGVPGVPRPGSAALLDLATLIAPGPDRISLSQVQLLWCGSRTWVAVRLSPVDAVAVAGAEVATVEAAVAAGVVRAARLLTGHGYEASALDPDRLLAALVLANGLDAAPQEHWSAWRSGTLTHITYAASAWPPGSVLAAPGVWASSAWLTRSAPAGRGGLAGGFLIRVAARAEALGQVCREVNRRAALAGVRLRRLDGDQAPAAYACGPTCAAVPRHAHARGQSLGSVPPGWLGSDGAPGASPGG